MIRHLRWLLFLLLLVVVVACELDVSEPPASAPVYVFAAYPDSPYLADFFADFSKATGVPVTVFFGESADLTNRIISNSGSPVADVLMTREIADLWRASDEGALRPMHSNRLEEIPGPLRDGDKMWAAINYQVTVIVGTIVANAGEDDRSPASYVDLAKSAFEGELCVTSSRLAANRALISMLIQAEGERQAERVVRGWMSNLAEPPFSSDEALLTAVNAGMCRYGLLSGWANGGAHFSQADVPVSVIRSQPSYAEIEGVGVARHARNPTGAQQLVDWLLSEEANLRHASAISAYPIYRELPDHVSKNSVGVAGWLDEDARLLADRASYR